MKNRLKKISLIILLGSLAGCAGTNSQFGCHATAGRGCMPVSVVNARANAGYYTEVGPDGKEESLSVNHRSAYLSDKTAFYLGEPIRTSEKIQRIWLAPYQDVSNNYHEQSVIYAVLDKPHWAGKPSKEIKETETQQGD